MEYRRNTDTSKMTQKEYDEWYMYNRVEHMINVIINQAAKHINKRHKKLYGFIRYKR